MRRWRACLRSTWGLWSRKVLLCWRRSNLTALGRRLFMHYRRIFVIMPFGFVIFVRVGEIRRGSTAHTMEALLDQLSNVLVHRARMCLLFGDTELRQHGQNDTRFNLEFPRQLINAFLHRGRVRLLRPYSEWR